MPINKKNVIVLIIVRFCLMLTNKSLTKDNWNNIYETGGSYGIEFQITKSVYSFIISFVLNKLLKTLALSNNSIIDLKQNKKKDISARGAVLNYALKMKFILYFVFSFIFLLFFWYYLSMFGAVYTNTQFHLLKDTLVS